MKTLFKTIFFTVIGIFIFGNLMYHISLWNQTIIFEKYTFEFNSKRNKIGLVEICESWKSKKLTWDSWNELSGENYEDGKISKFQKIFSFNNIPTGGIFETDSADQKRTNFRSKIIWMNSNILFWKNGIESEMDIYIKRLDSVTTGHLNVRYYFKDDNGNEDYFESNYYEINENYFAFCGTSAIMDREDQRISGKHYYGNLSKNQADSILVKWKGGELD